MGHSVPRPVSAPRFDSVRAVVLCALCVLPVNVSSFSTGEDAKVAGTDVPAPKRTKTVAPEYPAEAIHKGLRGIVILELLIDKEGHVASAEVVRSVPPFDQAALTAARKWEYEVTRVDGRAVSVRMTVPITFAMRLPELAARQEGIPELRQGAVPAYPPGASPREGASVTVQVTLDADGQVVEAQARNGGAPWTEALLRALRTWRFAPVGEGVLVSFRVEAEFVPASKGAASRVDLRLTGLHRSEASASLEAPTPAATNTPTPPPARAAPPAAPTPRPRPTPATAPPPLAKPTPTPVSAAPAPPATEVIPATLPPIGAGASAVADVTLSTGVPDLMKGRRPVSPPLARMAGASGTVEVRFAVDAAGSSSVEAADGPDLLRSAAEQAVASWVFRRVTAERLHLFAVFTYAGNAVSATVKLQE